SRRRHTRSKRDWSSDVCSSDLGEQNMCGITGLIGLNGEKITEISEVRKMMNAIIHRGPDDSGMAAFRVESQASFLDDEIQSGDKIGRASCRERGEEEEVVGEGR